MDKTSLAYIKDKAAKGEVLANKLEYCEKALKAIEEKGITWARIQAGCGKDSFDTMHYVPNIKGQDSVDCYGEIALQIIKDLRDRYQAEFDAL